MTWAISRCASDPENMSRMTTRETIVAAPALIPCSTRSRIKVPMLGASTQPNMPIR